jgi:3-oxoacyl-[acyl-carrier protein] reductase
MNTMLLQGKVAVVTGANRGIGRAILECFVAHGCSVYACARQPDAALDAPGEALAAAQGGFIEWVTLDLVSEDSIREASRRILSDKRKIDILVNNAGTASGALFQMTSMADMRRTFEVNLFGPMQFSQGLARWMARQGGGSIINLASTAAFVADAGTLAYGSSKAALARATQSMATELGAAGVRVNAIAPGLTKTDMYEQMDPAARDDLLAASALKRPAAAREIANVALFLASDLSSYVTGQVVRADGGLV